MNHKHPKRHGSWGQDNPRDQLRVLLGSIAGDLNNMRSGITNERQIPRMLELLEDAQLLAAGLPTGTWDAEVTASTPTQMSEGCVICPICEWPIPTHQNVTQHMAVCDASGE